MRGLMQSLRVAALVALLAGCGGDDAAAPRSAHVGTYHLQTVNGMSLPVTVYDIGTDRLDVVSGRVTLLASGGFDDQLTVRATVQGVPLPQQTISCPGRYQLTGSTITFTPQGAPPCDAGTYTGTLAGNRLTVEFESFSAVFTR